MEFESTLSGHNLAFLEALYETYKRDPSSVDPEWLPLLADLERGPKPAAQTSTSGEAEQIALQGLVDRLIEGYRLHGHTAAELDPLGLAARAPWPGLDPAYLGLSAHMDRSFAPGDLMPGRTATLREILSHLRNTYSRRVGVEYWHLPDPVERNWLQARMEACENLVVPSAAEQLRLLRTMVQIDNVDKFLHSRFLGAKRFSIAGAEAMIAMLDCIIEEGGELGVDELIIGMAHRGRLNVLMNILGKAAHEVFSEFGKTDPWAGMGAGDVKYHMGYFRDHVTTTGKPMYLALTFNPSHLEAITPVVQGRVRGKQDAIGDRSGDRVVGVTLHGDAAFAGQGVVQETLNLARLRGYQVGGSIRIIINNQVGFTTDPVDARSTQYATDVAHMLQVPIFHVNGDDVEAASHVARLAIDFRQRFKRDVIIDLVCYRRFGHNEGDDPSFTQPRMYEVIKSHPSVRSLYEQQLLARGTVDAAAAAAIDREVNEALERAHEQAKATERRSVHAPMHGVWEAYTGGPDSEDNEVETAIGRDRALALAPRLTAVPEGFRVHPKVAKVLEEMERMLRGEAPVSWGAAEQLAYASLVEEGVSVRMSGQDVQRGTFSHRHAVLTDAITGEKFAPLAHVGAGQGRFEIYNSSLSEYGVLGFEFGYSLIAPASLVIWEAQFGDFGNGAQIIIDNFIAACEDKWNRLSGLVMLLPHGYEGQGPEHSSARLERFLQLAAEDNLQICNLTSPAQVFHVLRRQVLRKWRKPLIMMTPKSLLRARPSFSSLEELSEGRFQRLIDDSSADPAQVSRVMLCSGKVYYDLVAERERLGLASSAIVRIEQLYPLASAGLAAIVDRYTSARELFWVQEEPRNMGAWSYVEPHLRALFGARLGDPHYVGRVASASPATGSPDSHNLERNILLEAAFAGL
jgi:2-oxoglutarate dehydrogenase E1 component